MRYGELAHCDLDFHARIVDRAEHLDHAPHRLHMPLRLLDDFNHHHLPWLGIKRSARRHQDVVADALILGHDDGHAALVQEAAHQRVGPMLDDLDDLAFLAATPVKARQTRQHAVTVQNLAHLVLGQRQVRAAVVTDQKAEAIAMPLHLTGDQIGASRNQQQAGAIAHQLAAAFEFGHMGIELRAQRLGHIQMSCQFIGRQRRTRARDLRKDVLAAGPLRGGGSFAGRHDDSLSGAMHGVNLTPLPRPLQFALCKPRWRNW